MKKLFLMIFIIVLLAATAIVVAAQADINTDTVVRMPVLFAQHSVSRATTDETCGMTPQVFELDRKSVV